MNSISSAIAFEIYLDGVKNFCNCHNWKTESKTFTQCCERLFNQTKSCIMKLDTGQELSACVDGKWYQRCSGSQVGPRLRCALIIRHLKTHRGAKLRF